jgi:hypothetical protein
VRRREGISHGDEAAGAGRRRRSAAGVQLAWALDRDGKKVAARSLDEASRRARAPFRCPGCGDPLVPHLGRVRARHFAHEAGSSCPLTAPETALHLNAKERLLALCDEAFSGRGRVLLRSRCPGCRRPVPIDLATVGDEARDEEPLGMLRPDVLVLKGGRPTLALEVLVTHAVDERKEAALAALGVPAAEIDAREDWEELVGGAVELVPDRCLGFARCAACEASARADVDRGKGGEAAEVAELEAYRARGLLGGPPPGRDGSPLPHRGRGQGEGAVQSLTPDHRSSLAARFRCPACGGSDLGFGDRLARHACPGEAPRPVAWLGYDGELFELRWWRP